MSDGEDLQYKRGESCNGMRKKNQLRNDFNLI